MSMSKYSLLVPVVVLGGVALLAAEDRGKDEIVSKAVQGALAPDAIIAALQKGNERFLKGELTDYDFRAQMKKTAKGQHPACILLGCIDSRVIPEIAFDVTIGDVFDARVAGNVVGPDVAGSLEYACAKAGSKLILVAGHTNCGAVKGAIDGVKLGNLTGLLAKIKPAIDALEEFPGAHTSENSDFVDAVVRKNVELTIEQIRIVSPVLKKLEDEKKIAIRGCIYNVSTGKAEFLKP